MSALESAKLVGVRLPDHFIHQSKDIASRFGHFGLELSAGVALKTMRTG
jgi:hypothetical protein